MYDRAKTVLVLFNLLVSDKTFFNAYKKFCRTPIDFFVFQYEKNNQKRICTFV